jgi:hypothetical protein
MAPKQARNYRDKDHQHINYREDAGAFPHPISIGGAGEMSLRSARPLRKVLELLSHEREMKLHKVRAPPLQL